MDRREFLETLAGVPATTPLAARSTLAEPAGLTPPRSSAETALPDANPRIRENFNRGWRFARQSQGTGALGSFDRQNDVAAQEIAVQVPGKPDEMEYREKFEVDEP
jgi:hypothetical protein